MAEGAESGRVYRYLHCFNMVHNSVEVIWNKFAFEREMRIWG